MNLHFHEFFELALQKDCFYESHQAMTCLVPSHFTQNVVPPSCIQFLIFCTI